jgi:magnesium transporter
MRLSNKARRRIHPFACPFPPEKQLGMDLRPMGKVGRQTLSIGVNGFYNCYQVLEMSMSPTATGDRENQQKKRSRKKLLAKISQKAGRPPGTMVHIGEVAAGPVDIQVMDYDSAQLAEAILTDPADCLAYRQSPTTSWINVDGVHQLDLLEKIGTDFGLHPLVLEDIVNTEHRPKLEDFDSYLFLVLKMLHYDETAGIRTEQISIILMQGLVLSFQERQGDVFNGVRERLRTGKGRIRKMGADYLAYTLLDAVVDSYFAILEQIGEHIERLEDDLVMQPSPGSLEKIHHFKREMILLRKAIWPLRELIGGLQRNESPLINETTDIFLRDVYDHTIQIIDTVETFRDILSGLLDLYLSSISNRMNEVMKVLTIIATIFIPLTFIAGIYGMNFDYMPELHWHWSYPLLLLIMMGMGGGMFFYFRKRHWL